MTSRILTTGIVLAGLIAATASGCATGTRHAPGSGDVVADRQRLMKLVGASWADIQAKHKAGQVEAIAVNAETIALSTQHVPSLFPAGSLTDKSKAKPEIWQKWDEFVAASKNAEKLAGDLRDAARAKDGVKVDAMVKDFGRLACGTCHTPFRVPPPQQPR